MKTWLVYKHTSLKSGKSYIGMTRNSIETRWKQHVSAAVNGSTLYFANALRLYWFDNWSHTILVEGIDTIEDASALEKYYIKKYDTSENGYNLTLGGEGASAPLEEYEFFNPVLNLRVIGSVMEISSVYNLHSGYLRYVAQKKSLHVNNWYLWEGENKNYVSAPVYEFEHRMYGVEVLTLKEMASKYDLSKGNLCMVAKGQRSHTKGWTLKGNIEVLDKVKVANNALPVLKIDYESNEVVAEYPNILHAAKENNTSESVIGDRCRGTMQHRCI